MLGYVERRIAERLASGRFVEPGLGEQEEDPVVLEVAANVKEAERRLLARKQAAELQRVARVTNSAFNKKRAAMAALHEEWPLLHWTSMVTRDRGREQRSESIYAIGCHPDFVKIGRAQNVRSRLAGLQTAIPWRLSLLGAIELESRAQAVMVEQALHSSLKEAGTHVHGEWFRDGEALRAVISSSVPMGWLPA